MNEKKPLNRFAYVDALRGLAALYVFFYHLALIPEPDLVVPYWAKRIVLSGGTGVTLFFVVSAFTLCYSMRARSDGPNPIYGFYVRRIFRIVPLFYVWMAISWLRDAYIYRVRSPLTDVFLSTFFIFNFFPGKQSGFVWASWTLGVEMLFYLIFPLVFRVVTDYRRALALFLFSMVASRAFQYLLAYLSISEEQRLNYYQRSFLHQLPVFATGVLVFYLFDAFIKDKEVNRSWGIVFLGMFVFIYDGFLNQNLNAILEPLYWQAVAYGCLLLGLSIFPWHIVVNRFTEFLGLISYSVYLSHTSVITAFRPLYTNIYSIDMSTSVKFLLCVIITLTAVVAVSYISYRLIEEPGMRFGRSLIRKKAAASYQPDPVSKTEVA
jgi:peptidoglycan/LPS O-acetylase OafA/YrhL